LGDNIDTIKKNTETLTDASKEVGLEVNAERSKYMLLSHHQNAGQNHNIKVANRSVENVAQLKYLRTIVTNQNLIQEEIKRRLNSDNACYHSVHNLLHSCLLYKKAKIGIYKTTIMLVVLCGYETWSLTSGEEHRLRVFQNRLLRKTFGLKRDEVIGGWRKLHNEKLDNLYSSPSIIRMIKSRRIDRQGM
jgi:hypothetical protein